MRGERLTHLRRALTALALFALAWAVLMALLLPFGGASAPAERLAQALSLAIVASLIAAFGTLSLDRRRAVDARRRSVQGLLESRRRMKEQEGREGEGRS